MRRTLFFLGLSLAFLTQSSQVQAQVPCSGPHGCGLGLGLGGFRFANPLAYHPQQGAGFCMRLFSGIHMHGPLVNYGPYSGYYPFEPYGPWNSNLQYTGPRTAPDDGLGYGRSGLFGRLRGGLNRGGCDSCGTGYPMSTFRNILSRLNPFRRGAGACDSCGESRLGGGLGLFQRGSAGLGLFQRRSSDCCHQAYAMSTFRNIFGRINPFARRDQSCSNCHEAGQGCQGCNATPGCSTGAPAVPAPAEPKPEKMPAPEGKATISQRF